MFRRVEVYRGQVVVEYTKKEYELYESYENPDAPFGSKIYEES